MSVQRLLQVNGSAAWARVQKFNGILTPHVIDISKCGDVPPPPIFSKVRFPSAHAVFLRACAGEFVYYYMDRDVFPRATQFYLDSHPWEPQVLHRFKTRHHKIYLTERFRQCKEQWAPKDSYVEVVSQTQFDQLHASMLGYTGEFWKA